MNNTTPVTSAVDATAIAQGDALKATLEGAREKLLNLFKMYKPVHVELTDELVNSIHGVVDEIEEAIGSAVDSLRSGHAVNQVRSGDAVRDVINAEYTSRSNTTDNVQAAFNKIAATPTNTPQEVEEVPFPPNTTT